MDRLDLDQLDQTVERVIKVKLVGKVATLLVLASLNAYTGVVADHGRGEFSIQQMVFGVRDVDVVDSENRHITVKVVR